MNNNKRKPYKKHEKPYNKNRKDGDFNKNYANKRKNVDFRPNFLENTDEKKEFSHRQTPINQFKLKGENTLCSFAVIENSQNSEILNSIDSIINSFNKIVVSIVESEFDKIKKLITEKYPEQEEKFAFKTYKKFSFELHNDAFKVCESDIFFVTHSGICAREYTIEILKRYLQKENNLVCVPNVYGEDGQIKKYSRRILTFVIQIKMLFSSNAKKQYIMMERGEIGYYKIHKVSATLAPFAVNSGAFKEIGGFSNNRDDSSATFTFFKQLNKHGVALFIPFARLFENKKPQENICFVVKSFYFIKNIF